MLKPDKVKIVFSCISEATLYLYGSDVTTATTLCDYVIAVVAVFDH